MFMTYTSKHYGNVLTNGQDCSAVDQPLTGDGLAYATQHSDAMQLRNTQVNVSGHPPTLGTTLVRHAICAEFAFSCMWQVECGEGLHLYSFAITWLLGAWTTHEQADKRD